MTSNIDRKKVFKKCNGHCAYCGKKLTKKTMTVDHVVSKADGGGNRIENLLPACERCNSLKGRVGLEAFRRRLWEAERGVLPHVKFLHMVRKKGALKNSPPVFYFEGHGGGSSKKDQRVVTGTLDWVLRDLLRLEEKVDALMAEKKAEKKAVAV